MQLDDKICYCFHVSKRKILNFLRVRRPRVPSQLSECGSAGTGCGWCVPFLKKYFAEWQAGDTADADDVNPDEYARQRGAYIRAGKGTPPPGATPPPGPDE
jgi:NAD(P)H-nitrite reductase large subunit